MQTKPSRFKANLHLKVSETFFQNFFIAGVSRPSKVSETLCSLRVGVCDGVMNYSMQLVESFGNFKPFEFERESRVGLDLFTNGIAFLKEVCFDQFCFYCSHGTR